jgi:hypothetical protein
MTTVFPWFSPRRARAGVIAHFSAPIALMFACAGTALAQPAPADTTPAAQAPARDPVAGEVLFREGRRLLKAGEIEPACAKLAESHRLDPAVGTLANLAECEERLGRTASAWEHWGRVAEQLPAADPRRIAAIKRAAELEKQLARLTIELDPVLVLVAPPGLAISRDGVVLGAASLGLALPLDPGPHKVTVSAPDHDPETHEVVIEPQEQRRLRVTLGPRRIATAAAKPAPLTDAVGLSGSAGPEPSRWRRPAGWALIGAGAVVAGAGAFFGSRALDARTEAQKSCTSFGSGGAAPLCWSRAQNAVERDATYSRLADVSFATAAVSAAVGAFFLFRGGEKAPVAAVSAAPVAGGAEVQLAGRF